MKHIVKLSAGILAVATWASVAAAQGYQSRDVLPTSADLPIFSPFRSQPCPPPCPPSWTVPTTPDKATTPTTPTQTPSPSTPDFSSAGEFKGSAGGPSSVFSGTGIGGAVTGDPTLTAVLTPLILPGLFTATAGQSAIPVDRIFFDYGYFNRVGVFGVGAGAPSVVQTTVTTQGTKLVDSGPPSHIITVVPTTTTTIHTVGVSQSSAQVAGFNLHTYNFGVEKTFLDGLASAYVSVPILNATDNISGQQINGLGDVSAGFKVILYQNLETGNTFTGGFTVSFPSGPSAVSNSYVQSNNGTGTTLLPASSISVNPTYFQPWVAGLLVLDRLYVQEYFAVLVPSDDRVATFLNSNFTVGYALYRSNEPSLVSIVSPTLGIQALIPVSNRGTPGGQGTTTIVPFNNSATLPAPPPPNSFIFTDQVFAFGGLQVGLGSQWLLSANVIVPVASPRGYNVGATFGLNYFY